MKSFNNLAVAMLLCSVAAVSCNGRIDRKALVTRNNPHVTAIDTMASLSVGNGEFAFTADVTGLQTFAGKYSTAVPLGTQSQWGWHHTPNPKGFKPEDALNSAGYSVQSGERSISINDATTSSREAVEWLRSSPHRLHLGNISFLGVDEAGISAIDQTLDMWEGVIKSSFKYNGVPVSVRTSCHPVKDMVAFRINSASRLPVVFRFPYPTAGHADDACDWNSDDKHSTEIVESGENSAIIERRLDDDVYYVKVSWKNAEAPFVAARNRVEVKPTADQWELCALFSAEKPSLTPEDAGAAEDASAEFWKAYWSNGGAVDFSRCTDPRAPELERRVVLSQYLLAIQCAGSTPPAETGLTYNSWYGKYHLEMTWWHEAHFALWGHPEMLMRTLPWYKKAEGMAREIARRQGYKGIRWMKMTDPSAAEAPSNVGSYLIWQQPHLIYMAELVYRANPSREFLEEYARLVEESAEFMVSFLVYDEENDRYCIKGAIPAQETLRADITVNPPFELSYWHYALSVAQQWRERMGLERHPEWDTVISKLSHLAAQDGLYLAAESATDTYSNIRMTSDHMAVLAAYGVLPECPLFDKEIMGNTLDWVMKNWNWDQTWGWDYPVTAMDATRLGYPEKALDAILMDNRTNTYLPNGHNYQNARLRLYLPGNGGLLTTVALMCAGWDGCTVKNPGFPKDGTWDVRWEGIKPMP